MSLEIVLELGESNLFHLLNVKGFLAGVSWCFPTGLDVVIDPLKLFRMSGGCWTQVLLMTKRFISVVWQIYEIGMDVAFLALVNFDDISSRLSASIIWIFTVSAIFSTCMDTVACENFVLVILGVFASTFILARQSAPFVWFVFTLIRNHVLDILSRRLRWGRLISRRIHYYCLGFTLFIFILRA